MNSKSPDINDERVNNSGGVGQCHHVQYARREADDSSVELLRIRYVSSPEMRSKKVIMGNGTEAIKRSEENGCCSPSTCLKSQDYSQMLDSSLGTSCAVEPSLLLPKKKLGGKERSLRKDWALESGIVGPSEATGYNRPLSRHSVGKHALILRELKSSDFEPREKFWTWFPLEGSKHTPLHQSVDFKWKDYCLVVFRHLRELFGIDLADYMLAVCGNDALREFSSPGKSGSFFYLTQDDWFMIKTVKKLEVKRSWFQELTRQVDRDCEFLEVERIMDYSLLIGLHFRDDYPSDEMGLSHPQHIMVGIPLEDITYIEQSRRMQIGSWKDEQVSRIEFDQQAGMKGSNGTPLNGTPRSGGAGAGGITVTGEVFDVVLYFGIIDILQDYDISKKLEHAYKSLQVDPASLSSVDPKLYSKRFRDFMHRIFKEED
ncbi:hypothetical protein Ancab_021676 [Ancistrocladus abbreviatus]